MSIQYSDVFKKFNYYKEAALLEFIQKGIYPDNSLISNKLKNIDMHLALFKHHNVITGDKFNTAEFNESIKLIYKDIKFLYELLEELQVKEYHRQQNFVESYMNELYSIVETYKKRADYENSSTTFGKTLLFQNNNFQINRDNSTTIIDIGKLDINNGTTISCIANINNVEAEDLVFSLTDENKESYQITPYNYSNETLTMPGSKITNEYSITMQEDQKITGPIILPIENPVDHKNKYTILAGKNKILMNYKNKGSYAIENVPTSLGAVVTDEKCYINFYVLNGNSISFRFPKKPLSANFPIEEQRISNLNKIHHFFIEGDKDFSFEIELDKGDIYAVKEPGIINNNKLFYTGTNLIKDFNVLEEQPGELKTYSASLKIYNDNSEDFDIESIIIKQVD